MTQKKTDLEFSSISSKATRVISLPREIPKALVCLKLEINLDKNELLLDGQWNMLIL